MIICLIGINNITGHNMSGIREFNLILNKMGSKLLKWFYDWGLFIIAIIIIIVYIILNSDISTQKSFNLIVSTNVLFTIINLLSAFYIARKVSMWGWITDLSNNQKKIAKTAIRHNRGNLASILKLIKITKDKIDKVDDKLTQQYLQEIENHLEMIYNGLRNSEEDFKEIVNEEMKEQNILEVEISELFNEIESKNHQLTEMSKTSDDKDSKITELKKQLREKESILSSKISSLPFGVTSFNSGSTFNIMDASHIADSKISLLNNLLASKYIIGEDNKK